MNEWRCGVTVSRSAPFLAVLALLAGAFLYVVQAKECILRAAGCAANYGRLQRLGRFIGVRPSPELTPREFATRFGSARPKSATGAMRVADAFTKAQYATNMDPGTIAQDSDTAGVRRNRERTIGAFGVDDDGGTHWGCDNRILVAGSINTDLVVRARRAPDAGETVTGTSFATFGGGKGANQAVAAARAGGSVAMLGGVGADDFGRQRMARPGKRIGHHDNGAHNLSRPHPVSR